jgi:hypothetical protein
MQGLNMAEVDEVGGAVSWQGVASYAVGAATAAGCVLAFGITAPTALTAAAVYSAGYAVRYALGK